VEKHPKTRRHDGASGGFTLVEMLVVIGIIGLLAGALIASFSHLKTSARQSQAQALVGETATALTAYLDRYREWPDALKERNGKMEMDEVACWVLQENKLLDVVVKKWSESDQKWTWEKDMGSAGNSLDRFGLLDPWGRAGLRRNPAITSESAIIEGGTKLSDHRLQYRLDTNFDGVIDGNDDMKPPKGLAVRASVIVWSRGPDGKDDFESSGKRYPQDDRLSWNYGLSRSGE